MPLEVFPGFWGFAHLVLADGFRALVDCGSGLDASNEGLEHGLSAVRDAYGEDGGWKRLTHVLIYAWAYRPFRRVAVRAQPDRRSGRRA